MKIEMPTDIRTTGSDALLEQVERLGFTLVDYTTPSGQSVWEWRRGDGPRPQFVTRRVALRWMQDWIDRMRSSDAS